MALTPATFLAPLGRLTPELFPGQNLTTVVQAWIDDAETKTVNEAAQAAWVYYRAFDQVLTNLMSRAASESVGGITASMTEDQRAYWRRERDKQFRIFQNDGSLSVQLRPLF